MINQPNTTQRTDSAKTLDEGPMGSTLMRFMSGKPMDEQTVRRLEERRIQVEKEEAERAEREKAQRISECVHRLAADLGKRYRPERARLDNFELYHKSQDKVLTALRELLPRLSELVSAGRGLIFLGPVGTGKDHLMAAALYSVAKRGTSARWFNGMEVFGAFRDRIDTGQRDREHFNELCRPDVLGLSDPIPPLGQVSAWSAENLYRILDLRYRAEKSTWVSVNASSLEDADAKLSAPCFDRVRHGAEVFNCFWPSFRERKQST